MLSNNDGCAVTRSPEAKALGIGMGEPWFKLKPRAKEWGLVALSSNYELYGDISARVMELLGRYSAWLEAYGWIRILAERHSSEMAVDEQPELFVQCEVRDRVPLRTSTRGQANRHT